MKNLVIGAVLALSVMAPAGAPGEEGGCNLIGAWSSALPGGVGSVGTMGIITGRSNSSGEQVFDTPVWENLSYVARVTMTGSWKRTGNNTFVFTILGWVPGADGVPAFLAKMTGTDTVSVDCNTVTIESTIQFFWLTGEPMFDPPVPVDTMTLYRILAGQ